MNRILPQGSVDSRPGWPVHGLEDDVRPRMFAAMARGEAFALATIVAADGGARPVGSQMVVTQGDSWGFLSGGCIESDVARNARAALTAGQPRWLVYGRGSPLIDIRLPCGGRIDVAIEPVAPTDGALRRLARLSAERRPAVWLSDGSDRQCVADDEPTIDREAPIACRYTPGQRLIVVGSDPFALAICGLGQTIGWETRLLAPFGPASAAPFGVGYDVRPLAQSLDDIEPDAWTAIAVATHDLDLDQQAVIRALRSGAGYVGVLGSRRKLGQRVSQLAAAGLSDEQIDRLHAPIGLPIAARSPWEVAVAVIAEIIASHRPEPVARPSTPVLETHAPA